MEDACIYDKSHRNEVVRQIAAEHGIARRTVLQYLWRYWVYQSKNALLPAERPAPEQHELTADEKAIRWALNKYYYTPQRQSLQTAYKMMLRAKYCDIVDLNSRFPQGIILCNGAVLYILMQMVPGKKSLQAVCITHRARS